MKDVNKSVMLLICIIYLRKSTSQLGTDIFYFSLLSI